MSRLSSLKKTLYFPLQKSVRVIAIQIDNEMYNGESSLTENLLQKTQMKSVKQ